MKRFIFLAKLGIIESTNSNGEREVQKIDDPQGVKEAFDLNFLPELLESDEVAKAKFKSLTHAQLERL